MSEPCIQQDTIIKTNVEVAKLGIIAENLKDAVLRLDKRINGTFDAIGKHLADAPEYRGKIERLEVEVQNIKEEKLNTIKNSQWRIGLIVGVMISVVNILLKIFFK